jgi:translation initiation factor 1
MSEVCQKCGLAKELCVCETIAKEDQRIQVKVEKRKFGKLITVITGINAKDIDIKDLAKKLKSKFACGGTVKGNNIELQGMHKERVKAELIKLGFAPETIEVK